MENRTGQKKDYTYMEKVFSLAKKGEGTTSPNPLVGAIIEKDNTIYGQGYHKKAGGPHAEIAAIRDAEKRNQGNVEGCTLYVNLEPCCHTGKTPPCTKAIIESGIKRVVIGMEDPNPLVRGKGIEELKKAGIAVTTGIMENAARKLNEIFCTYISSGMPFVTVKAAVTLDGKIATHTGSSQWITGKEARTYVHRQRHIHDGVMVGIGTVLTDNPLLTCRLAGENRTKTSRIIVDSTGRIPPEARVLEEEPGYQTIVAVTPRAPGDKITTLEQKNAEVMVIQSKEGKVDIRSLLHQLGERGITSVLVEGGGTLNASIIEQGLADKLLLFIAPKIIGGRDAPTFMEGRGKEQMSEALLLSFEQEKWFHSDLMLEYYFKKTKPQRLLHKEQQGPG
jgi:diaminohydroxyphosphoribosylaminopyrimidine deaminase / 5-amino-6-(5-phosphoribosylamino)uracil reductase